MALSAFCEKRRAPDRLDRWLAWYEYRAERERWDETSDAPQRAGAHSLLIAAAAWQRGFRPPRSFHEANARIRHQVRKGGLRGSGGGL